MQINHNLQAVVTLTIMYKLIHCTLYGKLLYEFYKAVKKSVDNDPGYSDTTSILREVIKHVFEKIGIPVIINTRIIQEFKSKIWRLKDAMAKAVCKGGGSVKRLFQRWEKGRNATWNFKIYYNEMEAERLKEENCILRC